MTKPSLTELQASVQDTSAFVALEQYCVLGTAFLQMVEDSQPTRIVSPNDHRYVFYQYDRAFGHKITRPLNSALFIESSTEFDTAFERLVSFLSDLRMKGDSAVGSPSVQKYLESGELNQVVYTAQQSIGSIGDSFDNPNQARKRIGQLFETLVRLCMQEIGFHCEPRTIYVPIPGTPDQTMAYELDLVFSRKSVVVAAESQLIHPDEIIGSVKTTSKDRIDKIFLDKFMLSRLLGRDVKFVAIFLHDVQRAQRANSIFGINSTFKTNHFLGYTMALNRLDGVYYVDPRPEMVSDLRLNREIQNFQRFLTHDVWTL